MVSKVERFWIIFILRFGIGFLFLFAALNIFKYGVDKFATDMGKPFESTWLADLSLKLPWNEVTLKGMDFVYFFLQFAPYVMAVLAVPILTGILVRPALRIGALVLICFGLGKYLQQDIATTAADFLFALIICIGLYFMSLEKREPVSRPEDAAA